MVIWVLIGLIAVAIPFILPIVSVTSMWRMRRRVRELEERLENQARTIEALADRLQRMAREQTAPPRPADANRPPIEERPPVQQPAAPVAPPRPIVPPAAPVVVPPPAAVAVPPPAPVNVPKPPNVVPPPAPAIAASTPPPKPISPPAAPIAAPPAPPRVTPPSAPPPSPPVPAPPAPESNGFDWESLIGVKLFSGIAGVALLLAAVFFLKYSVEHGWLQPPVRVAIGLVVAVGLLVLCELKAAREYPVTANALDASAIAILFATFFAAHSLWNLIPGVVAFGLLALTTAIAVVLSIRRESLFIAVLGLLGGFATPALLSTGENRPVPLFAYLLLLNLGLAWVSYRQAWPILSWLTVGLTTIYQWGWVLKFLTAGQLSLAMGIFLVFPLVAMAGLVLVRRDAVGRAQVGDAFEHTAVIAAALPLLFAAYLAAVPAYGAHPWLLLGFLLVLDLGLTAIAIALGRELVFGAAAVVTMVAMATLLSVSYAAAARIPIVAFTAAFVLLFALGPMAARRFGRPFGDVGSRAAYAAPLLMFVFPVLLRIEPAFAQPWLPLGVVFALLAALAAIAIASTQGALYFIAAFFAVAAQASWSVTHLTADTLRTGIAIYLAFGVLSIAVPMAARRMRRPLEPAAGSGIVVLAELPLLLFLAAGRVAPEALWALAFLLAVMNAGMFIESAAVGLPAISFVGSILSWAILAVWWTEASGSVGTLASLSVVAGLTLITLGGYGWSHRRMMADPSRARVMQRGRFSDGLFLGLTGHLFLFAIAANREWALPPWPLFGTLLTLTLAASVTSLAVSRAALHVAATIAAALVVLMWTLNAPGGWEIVGLVAAGAVSAYSLAWLMPTRARGMDRTAAIGAAGALFISEVVAIASADASRPPFVPLVIAHVVTLSTVLALTWRYRWRYVAIVAAVFAWAAAFHWQMAHVDDRPWVQLLVLASAMYAVFIAYPLTLGKRAGHDRDPYVAAIAASAMLFFAARAAFDAGHLSWMVGIIPVTESAVLVVLVRALLRIEAPGERDLGRLALVAGAALAFVTVAIPLQLEKQWITIGWALEGAALAWLYRRIPHRGLLHTGVALLGAVFVRLALNPEVFMYEPRGAMRIFNWYLYTYLICAVAMLAAAWWFARTDDRIVEGIPGVSRILPGAAGVLLFLLLNIEIADFYATGPEIAFRFGADVSQDLTYTIGWLFFGMALLAVGIWRKEHAARVAAVMLIAITTVKCFLYDLSSLGGLYRVASFIGLAMSLSLVAVALQRFVLARPKGQA